MDSDKIIQAINLLLEISSATQEDDLKNSVHNTIEKLRTFLYRRYLRGELCN
jgi:hypothetical protein